jgi:tripeptidyl-peptidase-1
MMAVAQGAPTTLYGIDQTDPTPFIDWLIDLGNDPNAPLVNSVSYGENELQIDPSVPARFNTEIQKAGARGLTVMVSSGDDGANGDGARNNVPQGCGFEPSYPATSPYVTAVGATQGPEASSAEVACSSSTSGLITTGGGFSSVWSTPSYQKSFVASYLASSNSSGMMPPSSAYAANGRGYPDVALLGHNYYIIAGGQELIVSGTSASSPVFGAMITLINAKRIAAGKPSLGFLNPALYQLAASNPSIFNDITSGFTNCPASQTVPPPCCQFGWPATQGWDATTGLGSVNFPKLQAALFAL